MKICCIISQLVLPASKASTAEQAQFLGSHIPAGFRTVRKVNSSATRVSWVPRICPEQLSQRTPKPQLSPRALQWPTSSTMNCLDARQLWRWISSWGEHLKKFRTQLHFSNNKNNNNNQKIKGKRICFTAFCLFVHFKCLVHIPNFKQNISYSAQ